MKKDAFYFPHDSNAKDDPKITLLIDQLGCEGYGIYWILVETLRDQPEYKYPIILLPSLARKYATTHEKVKAVVFNYNLFVIDNDAFFSISLNNRMIPLEKHREQRRLAGLKSAESRQNRSTVVDNSLNGRSTVVQTVVQQSKVKESIVKEKKVDNSPKISQLTDNESLLLNKWVEFRKQMKKPLTKISIDSLIEDFKIKGFDYMEKSINQSIKNGYQGLFEPKQAQTINKIAFPQYEPNPDIKNNPDRLKF